MRFLILICLHVFFGGQMLAFAPNTASGASFEIPDRFEFKTPPGNSSGDRSSLEKAAVLTLEIDSIHHVNCLRATGYLAVKAEGGTPGYTYAWSNGFNGAVATSLAPGDYDITVTDALGATATLTATILQDLTPPAANAGADFAAPCPNSIVSLNGSGSVGPEFEYLWTASGGGIIQSGANTLEPVISKVGTFTLKVTDTNNGCTATDAVTVSAAFAPPVAIALGGIIKCSNPLVTLNANFNPNNIVYEWTGPNGFVSGLLNPQVDIPGVYTFSMTDTVTTCSGSANATVTIDTISPTASAGGGGVITCAQPTVTLLGIGSPVGVTFLWKGPNSFISTLQNPVVNAAGTYTLVVTSPQNGCTALSSIDVADDLTPPTASASANGVLNCVTNSVQLLGDGSPAGVTFSWTGPNGFTSNLQNPTVLTAGLYTLTVQNPQNGCTATATATVGTNFTPPGASATGGVKTCANPVVTLMASSNTPGVTYAWSSGNFFSNQQNPGVTLIGTYTVTVTDPVNGCVSTASATVTQNLTPPTVTATSATVTCANPNPKIMANSQTIGATFAWTGPNGFTANIANPNVSAGGIYIVTVTNPANGCTTSLNVFVNENTTPPFVYAGEDRSLNCIFNSVLANPVGTSMGNNFAYQWTTWNGNIVSGANSLYARFDTVGNYTLTVINTQNGCVASDSMEVFQTPPVTASATQLVAVTCNGGSNGSAKVTGNGGNGVYSYNWSNGSQGGTANNLSAGTYTITVTDGEGCSATTTVTVTQPTAVQANVTTTHQTMQGLNNGTASVAPSGGTGPYTVLWSTGGMVPNIGALAPGDYTVTVTDSKGCSTVATATVNAVSCGLSGTFTATPVNCFGGNNGSAAVSVTGAVGPVTYAWSSGGNTPSVTNLLAGEYTVTVADSSSCTVVLTVQVTSPQQINISVASQGNVLCQDGQTGSAALGVSGGTAPYTYAWSNGTNGSSATNLTAGNYSCTVTDANGCTQSQSVQIIATDNNPPQLVLKNTTVALDASGVAVINGAAFDDGSTDECGIASWSSQPPSFDCGQIGTHVVTLTATDKNGNTATGTATVTIVDNTPPVLSCPQDISVAVCAATLNYDLPQVSDNCTITGAPTLQNGLPSGATFPLGTTQQTFSLTDSTGNTGTCSFNVTVNENLSLSASSEPTSCDVACNGKATVTVTGGVAPFQYSWSNGFNNQAVSGLCTGDYSVTVTDVSGCSQTQTVTVTAKTDPVFSISTNTTASSCMGACDGSAQLGISGGNTPITVSWDNGQSGSMLNGVCGGNYEATLTDASGCSTTHSVQIPVLDTQAPVLTCPANIEVGFCNATINYPQPQILDNCPVDQQQIQVITGLPSGATFPAGTTLQTLRYTDPGGNSGQCNFNVTVRPQLILSVDQITDDLGGNGLGSISISVNGGLAPYTFAWTLNGQVFSSSEDLTNLFPGEYAIVVTDAEGCTVENASVTVDGLISSEEPGLDNFWSLYPNPATSELFLKINKTSQSDFRIAILDATGRLLREQEIQPTSHEAVKISLEGLPEGWLLLQLYYEHGLSAKPFVKNGR